MNRGDIKQTTGETRPQPVHRFDKTFCSQCGQEFGPGDHGYSHCIDHEPKKTPGNPIARVDVRETGLPSGADVVDWPKYAGWVGRSRERNDLIAGTAIIEAMNYSRVLVLSGSTHHAAELFCRLEEDIPGHNADYKDAAELFGSPFKQLNEPALVHGIMDESCLWSALTAAQSSHVTVATACSLTEGVSVLTWPVIILASPTGHADWIQAAGLADPSDNTTLVIDFVDKHEQSHIGLSSRLNSYRHNGWRVHFPANYREQPHHEKRGDA